MMTDIVVRYVQAHPEVAATVAVSLFSPVVTPTAPKNLAVIDGDNEFSHLKNEGLRVVGMVSGGDAQPGVIYGSFADGSARRVTFSPGAEHLGVLYSSESMAEARDWLGRAFGEPKGEGYLDARGPYLLLLFFGITLLAWPLASLLPRVSEPPQGAGLRWREFLPVAVAPAILTPLLLWKAPTNFLPTVVADYITVHFGFTAFDDGRVWIVKRRRPASRSKANTNYFALAAAAILAAAYSILAFGLPLHPASRSPSSRSRSAFRSFSESGRVRCPFSRRTNGSRADRTPLAAYVLTKVLFLRFRSRSRPRRELFRKKTILFSSSSSRSC